MHFIYNMQVIETCGCYDFDDQIIKNGDLEELHEFRSETFGTLYLALYYGKWRGTDVAIKRFKKSCFAGGSSEQEKFVSNVSINIFSHLIASSSMRSFRCHQMRRH